MSRDNTKFFEKFNAIDIYSGTSGIKASIHGKGIIYRLSYECYRHNIIFNGVFLKKGIHPRVLKRSRILRKNYYYCRVKSVYNIKTIYFTKINRYL